MSFNIVWKVLVIFTCFWRPQRAVLRGTCSQCLTNGIACLDERTFAMCYHGTITNQIIKCTTGSVCTDQKIICSSELEGKMPICAEDNCDNCAPTQGRFACVTQTSYGFCFGSTTHNINTVRQCPDGMVCTLQGASICDLAKNTLPTCVPQIDDGDDIEPTDDPTATTEGTGVTTEGAVETTEDTGATTGGTGANTEDTEATTGGTGANTENTGATTESSRVTATTVDIGTTTEGIGATTDKTGTTTEDTGAITEETEPTTDETEATTEETGTTIEGTTLNTEGSTSTTKETMPTTEGSTATTEDITPITKETSGTTKKTTTDEVTITSEAITNTEETPSTEAGPIDLLTFCGNKKRMGYFKDVSDKTCKQYIYCYPLAGQYLGNVYKCSRYFSGITNRCQDDIPADCTNSQ